MNFYQISQILFSDYLLASENTVKLVLKQYEKAVEHGSEYVGLVKRPLRSRKDEVRVFERGDSRIGLIPIKGALTYEESGWEALCGMTSYEAIQGQAEYLIKQDEVQEIILELNSGGGQAYGAFEAAQSVRNMATKNGVKLTTYVDGVAYSGGYVWASIADEVIANPLGRVGSIGVVLPLTNYAERDKKEGIKRIYITSGKSKVPYDEDGNFTEESLEEFRKSSKIIYDEFVSHVAENRGIEKQAVIDTEAKTFSAKDALSLNLIDKIMTKEQFYEYIENLYGDNIMSVTLDNKITKDVEEVKISKETKADLITNLTEQVGTLKESVTSLTTEKESLAAQISTLNASVQTKDQEIETLKEKVKELTEAQASVVKDTREAKIKSLVPEDEVESVMSIASDLSDDKFNIFVKTLETKQDKAREEMKELGNQGIDSDDESAKTLADKIASFAK